MRSLRVGLIACAGVLFFVFGCASYENFVLDNQPVKVEILKSPPTTGYDGEVVKRTDITLPISGPSVTGNLSNGLAAITGSSYENGKVKRNKNRIMVYDLVDDILLWSATGNYQVSALYSELMVMRKGSVGPYLGLNPRTTRQVFMLSAEPRLYRGLDNMLISSWADSVLCFDKETGVRLWSTPGFPTSWGRDHFVKDRKLIIYGNYIHVIDVDKRSQWSREMSNAKVHTAEAMAINAGLCLLSACAGAATGTYYQTDYVEPRVSHNLGSMPVFTDDAVFYADAATMNKCNLENGNVAWSYDFSAEIQPATIILSIDNDKLLATFTGKKSTDNVVDTVADPVFKLLDARSGDTVWTVHTGRADHPRDAICLQDRSYILYKNELRLYDEADTLMAATAPSPQWGEFYAMEIPAGEQNLIIYCANGILELSPQSLQQMYFTEKPDEEMRPYLAKHKGHEAIKYTERTAKAGDTPGRNGLTEIEAELGVNRVFFTTTYEGGF